MRALGLFTPPQRLRPAADFVARHSAVIALALFAIVGIAVFDDYGISSDEVGQRGIGSVSYDYILGDEDAPDGGRYIRFYGVAFEIPLIAVERLLRLEDTRAIYLSRHLITHLFFLAGGFFAWLLARRLFGSRLIALFAMLLFLLHPRLYAHSFFNTKDLPFLCMFMIALYLTHRAFRRDTLRAFALCGASVGLLINIRVMGVALFAAVLGMLVLDAILATKVGERDGIKRAFVNAIAFFAASIAAFYATMPMLWRDPLSLTEGFRMLARHPVIVSTLFRGETVQCPNIPWDYTPTWALITTPPVALILAAVGIAHLARLCAARPRDILANSTTRFGLLAVACLTLPVAAAILLNSNLYNGWRHTYFLYAPICVLAAFGLRALAALPKPSLRSAAYALVALGLAIVIVQMVRLHPYQNEYFNILVNKSRIADRWQTGYWNVAYKEALETLLETQPTGRVLISDPIYIHERRAMLLIPEDDRRRLSVSLSFPSFYVISGDARHPEDVVFWQREVYGVPVVSILDARAKSEAAFRDAYAAARASGPMASAGGFDIYANENALIYIKEACEESDTLGTFQLSIFPSHRQDVPMRLRRDGATYESSRFDFWRYGATLDGDCLISFPLPEYPIHAIETEKWIDLAEGVQWKASIPLAESLGEYAAALSAPPNDKPAASGGGFDIYANENALIYIKEACGESDTRARFLLSVFPVDPSDLPESVRAAGSDHEPLNFDFPRYGATLDGDCVIIAPLPDYPVRLVETGQWTSSDGALWSAAIPFADYDAPHRAALESISGDPSTTGGGFDIYANGGTLIYKGSVQRIRRARTLRPLHIPRRPNRPSFKRPRRRLRPRTPKLRLPPLRRDTRQQMRHHPKPAQLPNKPHRNGPMDPRRRRLVERPPRNWRLD